MRSRRGSVDGSSRQFESVPDCREFRSRSLRLGRGGIGFAQATQFEGSMIMRNLLVCGLLLAGLCGLGPARAEQGCPAGLAPIGQAPGPICVPQPGYGIGGPGPVQQQPSAPQPRWLDRWGAVAIDAVAGKMGTATDRRSRRDAERTALKDCKSRGGTEQQCKKTLLIYGNGCGAVAMGADLVLGRGGGSIEEASARAMKECGLNSTGCEVLYTRCSYPVLVN